MFFVPGVAIITLNGSISTLLSEILVVDVTRL